MAVQRLAQTVWKLLPQLQSATQRALKNWASNAPLKMGMTVDEANQKAMTLPKKWGKAFFELSLRRQSELIGCSLATWKKTPYFKKAQGKRQLVTTRKLASPKTVSFTPALEAVTGVGEKDDQLNRLIAEQEADQEPSPLQNDPFDRPQRVYLNKRS